MSTKERRERERAELREKIIKAAEELFAEDGYKNISMRKISAKIDYSLPTIYQYFKNKADILFYIYQENNGKLLEVMSQISADNNSNIKKLKLMGQAYIKFGMENSNYYELAYMSNAIRYEDELIYNDMDSPGFKVYKLLLDTVKGCKLEGYFKNVDYEVTAQCLWSGIHGIISLLIMHSEFPWKDKNLLIENMINQLIK